MTTIHYTFGTVLFCSLDATRELVEAALTNPTRIRRGTQPMTTTIGQATLQRLSCSDGIDLA